MRAGLFIALAAAGLALAPAAWAKQKADAATRAAAFDKVAACRAVTDDAQRLTCFDKAVAALEAAEKSGDVVVVDRAQIHEAKRQVFGLPTLEGLNLFNRGGHDDDVDRIAGSLTKASQGFDGKWVLVTDDGQVWTQLETENFYPEPKAGDRFEIRRGALGSFFIKIDNNVSFKVRRDK